VEQALQTRHPDKQAAPWATREHRSQTVRLRVDFKRRAPFTTAGPAVFWQPRARWVFDEDESGRLFLTSSGVAAGGDAALALIARIAGDAEADRVATAAEWTWHRDADADPFATE